MIAKAFPDQQNISKLRNTISNSEDTFLEWPNVLVNTQESKYCKKAVESSFTLLLNNTGNSNCILDKRKVKICSSTFFIINPYQSFEYEINSLKPVETLNIHYNFEFLQESLYFLLNDDQTLLNLPERDSNKTVEFINQLHYRDAGFNQFIREELFSSEENTETTLINILDCLLKYEDKTHTKIRQIKSVKTSVKKELFRKVCLAKDYIFSNYDRHFSIDDLCREIGLSKFHFLRTFKSVYGFSPYQYLKHVRLERAKVYLKKTSMPTNEISSHIGFEEVNSFYNAFKDFFKITPTEYRKNSNFQ